MAVYDGIKEANDYLIEVAKKAVVAALKAPQVTGKLQLKASIITGEDLLPFIEILGILGETSDFIRGDHVTLKKNYEKGTPPVILALGANCSVSELNWNCGACGFNTCGEFNRFAKENQGMGSAFTGPSCVWKTVDFGAAVDWAAAAIWHENVDNRVQDSVGAVSSLLGYNPGCTYNIGISLGPPADLIWYNRPDLKHDFNQADIMQSLFRTIPEHFLCFVGDGNPQFKYTHQWFQEPRFLAALPNEKATEIRADQFERIAEVIFSVTQKRMQQASSQESQD